MKTDCETARRLAMAPEITRKSLHIHVKYHYIRQLIARGDIVIDLVKSSDMRADVLTKFFPTSAYLRLSRLLMNHAAIIGLP